MAPSESPDIHDRLRGYVTRSAPLGPNDAGRIVDVEVAAKLFDVHNKSFHTLLRRELSVLIGRRGSGKTALLNSYKYRPFLDRASKPAAVVTTSDFRSYDIVIDVLTYKQFDDMQRMVRGDTGQFRPVEAIVDDWENLVTDYFFAKFIELEITEGRHTESVKRINHYLHQDVDDYKRRIREMVWGPSLPERIKDWFQAHAGTHSKMNRADAIGVIADYLRETKRRVLLICDSMDEYNIGDKWFDRTLGALIRFISQFNARQDRVQVKLGLPSEIYPEVSRASANALKDLGDVDQVTWTALELAQIAAHRFRLFLELYEPDEFVRFAELNINDRTDVRRFWSLLFPATIKNRFDVDEEPLTYILRHTQLLPRQFLMILHKMITRCHTDTGTYRSLGEAFIRDAIEDTEPLIASEIFQAFEHVYPVAEKLCKPVFANFSTVFSYDELEDRWRKLGRAVAARHAPHVTPEFDMPEFAEMVIRMGIIGVGHDETERYYEGHFGYDSLTPMNIGQGHALCLHPIFSRHFNASGNAKRKAVIAKGVSQVRWRANEQD